MATRKGYIKFPRSIFGSKQWRKERVFSEFEAAAYLCAKAAFVDGLEVNVEGRTFRLQRGQLITSIRNLAQDWGWSKSGVQRLLSEMQNKSWDNIWDNIWDNLQIKIEPLQKTRYTLITICNYDNYECDDTGCYMPQPTAANGDVGTTCGTTCGTSNNNDIRNNEITSTHTSNILTQYKQACACADMREQARELCEQLYSIGFFQTPEYHQQTDAFKLLTHIWLNYPEMQRHFDSPMIASEAIQFVNKFGFSVETQDDVARVLLAMNNTKGLHKRNRSVYHTLRKWLQQDKIRIKRIEDEQARIYQPRR